MLERIKAVGQDLKRELKVYQLVIKDGRTPKWPKFLLGCVVGYVLLPFDIIPDFIPVVGHIDDVIIVPALVYLALRMIDPEVVEDCRKAVGSNT